MEGPSPVSVSTHSAQSLHEMRRRAVPRGVGNAHPIFIERAEGARVWDIDGKEYIDFVGGIGVLNIGHRHPHVLAAIRAQLERLMHTCFQVAMYDGYVLLADALNRVTPGTFAKKTLLLSTGAEAIENAVKITRQATGRQAIVTFSHGFHGRTLLTLSMTGKSAPYKQNFGPYSPEVYHAPFPYEYRGWSTAQAIGALYDLFETQVQPDRVAAVVIEPVLGEGGFIPAPADFLVELREITERHGILLVADEIQSGFGRTGKMFAVEHSGVVPDIVVMAKSLAAGLPLSAVTGRAEVMDAPFPGGLGGTYAGNPVACAAALATLEVFEREHVLERAGVVGERIARSMAALHESHRDVGDVRGLGAMRAMELVTDRATRLPNRAGAERLVEVARSKGLLLMRAGLENNTIRVLVPLTVSDEELDLGLERLAASTKEVLGSW
ncbi:4-aminobutyrate--2-oxoglutarate transaminase [bacterium]|nr:MAG: 4-aminobutyrate--2-oxoglutarate transaminase [bacterium]